MNKAPVLFDIDGTLVNSGSLVIECFQAALSELGLPVLSAEELRPVVGPPLAVTFREMFGLPEGEVADAIALYRSFYIPRFLEPPLYPGVSGLLADLSAAGFPMATATTKLEKFAALQMEHWGLDRYFVTVAGATTDSSNKTTVVASALSRLTAAGFACDGAVLVGDRSFDVEGASANGIRAIGAGWGYGVPSEFESPVVLGVAGDVEELRGILLG